MTSSQVWSGSGWTSAALKRAFSSVLRERGSIVDARGIDAERDEKLAPLPASVECAAEQRSAAAGVDEAGRRIAAGEDRRLGQPRGAFVEGRLAARRAQLVVDRAAEHDDAVGRRHVGGRRGKPVLQRLKQQGAPTGATLTSSSNFEAEQRQRAAGARARRRRRR